MEQFIFHLAEKYFREHRDDFGENAVFHSFVKAEGCLTIENTYPTTVFGYLAYQVGDEVRVSNRMRIQYLVCDPTVVKSTPSQWFASEATFHGLVWPNVRSTMDETLQLVPKFCASAAYWRPARLVAANMFENPRAHLTWGYSRCLDLNHLSLMARKIGQFHGCVLRHRATKGELLMKERSDVPELYSEQHCKMLQPTLLRCMEPLYTDPLYTVDSTFAPGVAKLAAKITGLEKYMAAMTSSSNKCQILCHMNYSQASVFFKYEGEEVVDAMIGNWATADYCSLGADLVILLFVEGDAMASHKVRQDLINVYYNELRQFCPEMCLPHLREVVMEIKRCVPIALFALGARVAGLSVAPCLSMCTIMSAHWNDEFARNVFKNLILNRYI